MVGALLPECQATASSVGGPVGADRWSARSQPHPRMAWIYRPQCPVEADLGRRFAPRVPTKVGTHRVTGGGCRPMVGTEPTASTHGVDLPTVMPGEADLGRRFAPRVPTKVGSYRIIGEVTGRCRAWSARNQPHPRVAWIYRLQCPVEADLGRRFVSLSANQGWQLPHHRWVDRWVPTVGRHGTNRIHAWRGSTTPGHPPAAAPARTSPRTRPAGSRLRRG